MTYDRTGALDAERQGPGVTRPGAAAKPVIRPRLARRKPPSLPAVATIIPRLLSLERCPSGKTAACGEAQP